MNEEVTEGAPVVEEQPTQEVESAPKDPAPPKEEEYETVRSANREWKLPKDAAQTFKQLERAYRNTTKELASIKKNAILEQDPDKIIEQALSRKGVKLADFAEQALLRQLQEMEKSPEARLAEELAARLAKYEQREQEEVKTKAQKEEAELNNYVRQELDKEIAQAMSETDMTPSPYVMKQISAVIVDSIKMMQSGKLSRVLTAKEAANIVKEEHDSSWMPRLKQLPPGKLLEILGQEQFNKMKQEELARLQGNASKAGLTKSAFGSSSKEPSQNKVPNRPLTEKEYRNLMETGSIA